MAKRGGHFPRPISPVVTRTPPIKRPRIWSDDWGHGTSPSIISSSPSPTIAQQGVKTRALRPSIKLPSLNLVEEAQSPPTPIKNATSTGVTGGEAVAPSPAPPPPPSPPEKLRFRLRSEGDFLKNGEYRWLVSELSRLSTETRCLPRDPKAPGQDIGVVNESEQASAERNFFDGLSRLSLTSAGHLDDDEHLGRCVHLILPLIRARFGEYVNYFRLYRQGVFDHTFTEKLQHNGGVRFEVNSPDASQTIDFDRFDEDSFAGATTWQAISDPYREGGDIRPLSHVVTEERESTWKESTAAQATEGILACLRKICLLFNFARAHSNVGLLELANFVTEALEALSSMLSVASMNEETVVNDLPVLWMPRLTRVIHECLHLASCFALEFSILNNHDTLNSGVSWSPSILSVFLLVTYVMSSKTSLEGASVILPALRLLTHLMESGRLEPPEHSSLTQGLPTDSRARWWERGGDSEARELIRRVRILEKCEGHVDGRPHPFSYFPSKVSPKARLGCPLLFLCRLVNFEHLTLDRKDVRRRCRLLVEFGMFTTALASTNRWARCTTCPCTLEIYSTLIKLALPPMEWLFMWKFDEELRTLCLGSLGSLTQTLHTLLLAHGEEVFQLITNRIPEFFTVISRLSHLPNDSSDLVHPELVEELYDFDAPQQSDSLKPS